MSTKTYLQFSRRALVLATPLLFAAACSARAIPPLGQGETQGADQANAKDPYAASPWRKLSKADWQKKLSPSAFAVLREADTERPFTSPLNAEKRPGIFHCAGCDLALFDSAHKFDSGTGWPSFSQPLSGALKTKPDNTFFMQRTEYHCAQCLGHQGHVFDDGPPPTGQRYCNNGVALSFKSA